MISMIHQNKDRGDINKDHDKDRQKYFIRLLYVPCFISKIRSFESTKLLTLSVNCRAND